MASEIKANKISPATGTAFTLGDSGDTFTLPSGATLAVASGATISNAGTQSGFGKVLQVLSTDKTDTWSSSLTSGAEADVTGLSVSITPSSTSSKILIMASVTAHNGGEGGCGFLIRESGTMIIPPDSAGSRGNGKVHANNIGIASTEINATTNFQILHSPSSTSALTYQIRVLNYANSTRTMYVNGAASSPRFYGVSTITAMEIAG